MPKKRVAAPTKIERLFVSTSNNIVTILSDELGDEIHLRRDKMNSLLGVSIEGMAEQEPVILLHFDQGASVEITYNSRTNAKLALSQVLKLLDTTDNTTKNIVEYEQELGP